MSNDDARQCSLPESSTYLAVDRTPTQPTYQQLGEGCHPITVTKDLNPIHTRILAVRISRLQRLSTGRSLRPKAAGRRRHRRIEQLSHSIDHDREWICSRFRYQIH